MDIQQAIFEANKTGKYITRIEAPWLGGFLKLKLGDKKENYLFDLCGSDGKKCERKWKPQLSDIIAEDWKSCN